MTRFSRSPRNPQAQEGERERQRDAEAPQDEPLRSFLSVFLDLFLPLVGQRGTLGRGEDATERSARRERRMSVGSWGGQVERCAQTHPQRVERAVSLCSSPFSLRSATFPPVPSCSFPWLRACAGHTARVERSRGTHRWNVLCASRYLVFLERHTAVTCFSRVLSPRAREIKQAGSREYHFSLRCFGFPCFFVSCAAACWNVPWNTHTLERSLRIALSRVP